MFKKISLIVVIILASIFLFSKTNHLREVAVAAPDSNIITEQDYTGDGKLDLRLDNGQMWIQINRDIPPAPVGFIDEGGMSGEDNIMRSPISSGGMVDQIEYWNTISNTVLILENSSSVGSCKVTIVDQANGKEITREYTVSLEAGKPYAIIHYLFRNTGSESFLYDEYPTHIHDGAHLGSLAPVEVNDIDTYIHGVGVINLPSLYWWYSYTPDPNEPFSVVYQPSNGNAVTFGFISPFGSPIHQIVAHYNVSGTPDPSIDVMATEFALDPGATIEWNAMVAFHAGGYPRGIMIYDEAAQINPVYLFLPLISR